MAILDGPMEFLDLEHGHSVTLQVSSFLEGETVIAPRNPTQAQRAQFMQENGMTDPPGVGHPITVTIPVVRLFGTRLDEPDLRPYWDISSKTLIAQLTPQLRAGTHTYRQFTITANGVKPKKRYSLATS